MESKQKLSHASYRLTLKTMEPLQSLISTTEQKSLISYSAEKSMDGCYVITIMLRFVDAASQATWEESILKGEDYLSFEPLS